MEQLTGIDSSFLDMETPTTFGHVLSVSILDASASPEALTLAAVRRLVLQRVHLLTPFRRRLAEVPFGADRPYWVEDPGFDVDAHLRETTLREPGDALALAEAVNAIMVEPLDRTKPLWQLHLLLGVSGDRVALVAKIHHAAMDGIGGKELMSTLLDGTARPEDALAAPPWNPAPLPTQEAMMEFARIGMESHSRRMLSLQQKLMADVIAPAGPTWPSPGPALADDPPVTEPTPDGGLLAGPRLVAPHTSFNKTVSGNRNWSFGSMRLSDVQRIKKHYGVTVNDVIMSLCAGALRRWLIAHEELPEVPLVAMVPISVRTEQEGGGFGNRVSALLAPLPTDVADPVERLHAAHEAMRSAKEQHRAIDADLLSSMAEFALPAMAARAARVASELRLADTATPSYNLVISNIPGPQTPLYLAGAPMQHQYVDSVINNGMGLNICVQSYLGTLDIGVASAPELMPDIWSVIDFLDAELHALLSTMA